MATRTTSASTNRSSTRSVGGSKPLTRVETFGDDQANGNDDVHWIKVLADARSREVFAYQPRIVPPDRTAVPVPYGNARPLDEGELALRTNPVLDR